MLLLRSAEERKGSFLIIEEEKKLIEEEEEEEKQQIDLAAMEADWVDDDGSRSAKSDLTLGDDKVRRHESISDQDSDSHGSDSDESIDVENLPEDRIERFELLGIDPSILDCGEEELIMITESSMIEDLVRKQDERRRQRALKEKEQKKDEAAKDAAKQAALIKETDNMLNASNQKLVKVEVTTTEKLLFSEDSTSNYLV